MKKIISIAILIIAIFSSTSFATENAVWQKDGNFHSEIYAERYTIHFNNIYCTVNINIDGDLEIYTTDSNFNGKTASQYLRIKDGNVIEDRSSVIDHKDMFMYEMEGGYSVFVINVSPHASSLPRHVREKFKGTCDVE